MTKTLLTAADVADLLGMSAATVSRRLKDGGLPSIQCGARRVFERD
ncbi:helix-turn-helix domain-containing protein, partial [Bifidobacterium breve]